jgi:hypothetical protein
MLLSDYARNLAEKGKDVFALINQNQSTQSTVSVEKIKKPLKTTLSNYVKKLKTDGYNIYNVINGETSIKLTVETPLEDHLNTEFKFTAEQCILGSNTEPTIYAVLVKENINWCRYCGTTNGVCWRPGPWAKNTLCKFV